jgi:mitotic spindle assembly checkpoint protein MAD2
MQKTITRLVLAITSKETMETVERWQFDIITEDEGDTNGAAEGAGKLLLRIDLFVSQYTDIHHDDLIFPLQAASTGSKPKEKTEKEVQVEIREIMKQITASVTFLPVLEEECKGYIAPARLLYTPGLRACS